MQFLQETEEAPLAGSPSMRKAAIQQTMGLTENCVGVAMVRARARARRVASGKEALRCGAEMPEGHGA